MASRDQAAQPRWPSAPTAPPCCSRICRKASSAHSQRHEDPRPVGIRCVAGSCSAERPRRSVAVYIQRPGRPASADPHSLGTEMATSAEPTGARRGLPPVPVHGEPRPSFCWGHTGLPGERGCSAGPPTQQLPAPQQEARACAPPALHCSGSPHLPHVRVAPHAPGAPKGYCLAPGLSLPLPREHFAAVLLSSTGLAVGVAGFGSQTQLLPPAREVPSSFATQRVLPAVYSGQICTSFTAACGRPPLRPLVLGHSAAPDQGMAQSLPPPLSDRQVEAEFPDPDAHRASTSRPRTPSAAGGTRPSTERRRPVRYGGHGLD